MKKAVILFNLGGPDTLSAVEPFLFNLFNDPAIISLPVFLRYPLAKFISKRRTPVAKAIYAEMGGKSPILEETQTQADAIEKALQNEIDEYKCFIVMRCWNPRASETIKKVLLPAALPGIVGAMLLAVSRAIGETMIVVMAAGMAANLTANPLDSVTTVTVQIVALLTGDQEFDSPKTLAAFALGLMLFITTLALNIIALKVVRKYREQYE